MFPVVERDVERVLRTGVQQSRTLGIFANDVGVAQRRCRNAGDDELPALAKVRGLVDPWIAIVLLVRIHDEVRAGRRVARRLDVPHGTPLRNAGNVRGDVCPRHPTILRDVHEAVVASRPHDARLHARLGDGVHHVGVLDADVVRREPAGNLLLRLVVAGEVGTDDAPALATIGGHVHKLAAGVEAIVVVR